MDDISREFTVPLPAELAFYTFVDHLNEWWPAEYTWSQDQLQKIAIEAKEGGLCTEIGPHGFRCDWGRVVTFEPSRRLSFTWQISPQRVPVPDPNQSSCVYVSFIDVAPTTDIEFKHVDFEKHGEGAQAYQEAMNSPMGWDYILNRYQTYCTERSANP